MKSLIQSVPASQKCAGLWIIQTAYQGNLTRHQTVVYLLEDYPSTWEDKVSGQDTQLHMETNVSSAHTQTYACVRLAFSCQESISAGFKRHIIFNVVLSALLTVTAVLGNGLVFAAYNYSETLRRPAHVVLMSLAATDFLSGIVTQPLFIVEKALLIGACSDIICILKSTLEFSTIFFSGATVLNLSVITLERYIAVCHTYKYAEWVINSRVKKLLVIIWFVWLTVCSACLYLLELKGSRVLAIVLVTNVVFISILYVKIAREIRRIGVNAAGNEAERDRLKNNRKTLRILLLIFGLLFLCFLPLIIFGLYKVMTGISDLSRTHSRRCSTPVTHFSRIPPSTYLFITGGTRKFV